ncbi:hypothetical protein J4E81_008244 [Alternaria sp. BMP 2799]|nr:hypothetical protein J4E81_008244 [Alternaria sp. BMP 2799]
MAPEAQAAACAVCGEPANNKCGACKSDTSSRQYCGKACQVKDWPNHKKACKDAQNANLEEKLARIARIVQWAYYNFRERTWAVRLSDIEDRADALIFHGGGMPNELGYLVKFPQHLVTNDHTKKAMLCAFSCDEALAWMHDLLAGLTEGMDVKFDEVSLILGRVLRRIMFPIPSGRHVDNWPSHLHDVLRITATKSKKQWIIDLSGAQYGICRTLWTWEEYKAAYAANISKVQAFGVSKARFELGAKLPGLTFLGLAVGAMAADHMNEAVNKWKVKRALSLPDLIRMRPEEHKQAILDLLGAIDKEVYRFTKNNDFKEEFAAATLYETMNPGKSEELLDEINAAFLARAATP